MIQKTEEGFKFSSGRSFYANGYIGICEDKDGYLEIAEGYDGGINLEDKDGESLRGEPENELTNYEKEELANYMIGLWTKFKMM